MTTGTVIADTESSADAWLTRLQEKIDGTIQQTEQAVLRIGELLNQIVDLATADIDTVRAKYGIATQGGASEGSQIERSIDQQTRLVETFVDEYTGFLERQVQFAKGANEAVAEITQCAKSVSELMSQSHLLALNMQIETARLGETGRAMEPIAKEMKNFSLAVKNANVRIVAVVDKLNSSLPTMISEVAVMERRSETFSASLREQIQETRASARTLSASLFTSVADAEVANREILRLSQETLSALQFQDLVAAQLRKLYRDPQWGERSGTPGELGSGHHSEAAAWSSSPAVGQAEWESDAGSVVLF